MRISDWSSDVCSPDLPPAPRSDRGADRGVGQGPRWGASVAQWRHAGRRRQRARNAVPGRRRGARRARHRLPRIARARTRRHLWPDRRTQAVARDPRRLQGFAEDRKSVVTGKRVSVRVDLGGRRIITKKKKNKNKQLRIKLIT